MTDRTDDIEKRMAKIRLIALTALFPPPVGISEHALDRIVRSLPLTKKDGE